MFLYDANGVEGAETFINGAEMPRHGGGTLEGAETPVNGAEASETSLIGTHASETSLIGAETLLRGAETSGTSLIGTDAPFNGTPASCSEQTTLADPASPESAADENERRLSGTLRANDNNQEAKHREQLKIHQPPYPTFIPLNGQPVEFK